MNLTQVYLEKTMSLNKVRLKHHWMDVLPDNSLVKLIRRYDVSDMFQGEEDEDLRIYFDMSPVNFMYPMFFFKTLLGYAFRSIEGKDFTVKNLYPMIGFTASQAMLSLNQYRGGYNQPLILVEGVSDAEAVSSLYPWVVAVMGNKVKNIMAEIIPWYAKRIFLLLDNDSAGESGAEESIRNLGNRCQVTKLVYPESCEYKDPAEIFKNHRGSIIKRMIKDVA